MSKPNRDHQFDAGEQLLRQWGLAADAGVDALRAVSGREPVADLAIAARLGTHADAASAAALRAMEEVSADKRVRKEVRRSLYRLEQRGVALPAPLPLAPPIITAAPLEGYVSAIDGRGDQFVWLIKPRPSGIWHLFAIMNDPDGLREVELNDTTRKAVRGAREELLAQHDIRVVETDWRYCDFLIDRAFRWASEKHHPIHGDYPGARTQLVKEPVRAMQPLIATLLDVDTVRADAQCLAESEQLLEEPEFRTWIFTSEDLKPYLDELQQMKESPLVLNELQQRDRFTAVLERAVVELFGGAGQSSWARRLQEMAYFLHATGRRRPAAAALAAALALETSAHGGRGVPCCEVLVRACLAAVWQAAEQQQTEVAKESLVVTPAQALREAQQQRHR